MSNRLRGGVLTGTIESMDVLMAMRELEGYATRDELLAMGCWPERIDMSLYYGKIVRVRRGHYVSRGTARLVIRALRVGGRLACVSALDFYRGRERPEQPIHVLVTQGSSRLGVDVPGPAVIHWSRRRMEGTRVAVSEQVARSQTQHCVRRGTVG